MDQGYLITNTIRKVPIAIRVITALRKTVVRKIRTGTRTSMKAGKSLKSRTDMCLRTLGKKVKKRLNQKLSTKVEKRKYMD
jgi:hypothetical protein